jgi:hypothetical protein
MNINAVIELVDGVENEEITDFVINLCRCKCCEIALVRYDKLNNCSIVTIFYNNNKSKVADGQKSIKDLSVPKSKDQKLHFILK